MDYKGILIILALVLMQTMALSAVSDNAGTTGFSFLSVVYSAQATAMGNAFVGQADQVETLFYNPAGLAAYQEKTISSSYVSYFEGFQGGSLIYGFPFNETVGLALYAQYLGTDSINRTEVDGQGNFIPSSGTFGANNLVVGLTGGKFVHEMLSIGLGAKFIREALDDHSATAIALDIGLQHQTANEHLRVGVALKNIGQQITYHTSEKYKEDLPRQVTVGFNYSPQDSFNANLDIVKPFEHDLSARVGLQYQVHPILALRAGFDSRSGDWKAGGDYDFFSGLSTGFGCHWRNYNLDYSISSYGDLGTINQISLKYTF